MEMLQSAYNQGVRNIVCSSHSWSDVDEYYQNFNILKRLAKKHIGINLHTGCEVKCSLDNINDIINKLNAGEIFTINNTNCVLVEFDPYEYKEDIVFCITKLLAYGYEPIIAHVERYLDLMNDDRLISILHDNNILFQINCYSLVDEQNDEIKYFARKMLKNKMVSFIGSDAHRTDHRPYVIKNGIDYIFNNCEYDYAKDICCKNAEMLFCI
jgi:protein-tyrosine phosphatase